MLKLNVKLEDKTILVTGAAGFIGAALAKRLLSDVEGVKVVGMDNLTDYYDVSIKQGRLKEIEALGKDWVFVKGSIADKAAVEEVFGRYSPAVVVNLAAQAGVPYLYSDFKKKDGYKRSIELSHEYDLYRQDFCGCAYSRRERLTSGRRPEGEETCLCS